MDPQVLSVARLDAGRAYLAAIEELGLRPSGLFWAWDETVEQFVLVLITHAFDYAGPLALSKTLFAAYNKSGTPQEIDPFIVRLHSPQHAIVHQMANFLPFKAQLGNIKHANGEMIGDGTARLIAVHFNASDLKVHSDWVYRFEKPAKVQTVDVARRWTRFVDRVDKLAA